MTHAEIYAESEHNQACDCEGKITLCEEGRTAFVAGEYYCPEHGYQNSCWMCDFDDPNIMLTFSTELCTKHRRRRGVRLLPKVW